MFVAIEGPNGAGKTTAAKLLGERLAERRQLEVLVTTEPTGSDLGRLLRFAGEEVTGLALALGIAADRVLHIEREILPALERGVAVITDRYVPSSLVLQRIDGLDLQRIWTFNESSTPPDVTFYLRQSARVLAERLRTRPVRSRMEAIGSPQIEVEYYEDARLFLQDKGWNQYVIDCGDLTPEKVADQLAAHLDELFDAAYK